MGARRDGNSHCLNGLKGGLLELLCLAGTAVLIGRRHRYCYSIMESLFEGGVSRSLGSRNDSPPCQHRALVFSRVQRLASSEGTEDFAQTSLSQGFVKTRSMARMRGYEIRRQTSPKSSLARVLLPFCRTAVTTHHPKVFLFAFLCLYN
jgi:hypothetical protein